MVLYELRTCFKNRHMKYKIITKKFKIKTKKTKKQKK